jgi:hypothetical protein
LLGLDASLAITTGVTVVGNLQVPLQREYSDRTWHFEYQVSVVGGLHKPGDGWPTEDSMVGGFKVRNLELDVLGVVILPCPEGNWQDH